MCLHPFKGWSWLCSAAEFAVFLFVFFFFNVFLWSGLC